MNSGPASRATRFFVRLRVKPQLEHERREISDWRYVEYRVVVCVGEEFRIIHMRSQVIKGS